MPSSADAVVSVMIPSDNVVINAPSVFLKKLFFVMRLLLISNIILSIPAPASRSCCPIFVSMLLRRPSSAIRTASSSDASAIRTISQI